MINFNSIFQILYERFIPLDIRYRVILKMKKILFSVHVVERDNSDSFRCCRRNSLILVRRKFIKRTTVKLN